MGKLVTLIQTSPSIYINFLISINGYSQIANKSDYVSTSHHDFLLYKAPYKTPTKAKLVLFKNFCQKNKEQKHVWVE